MLAANNDTQFVWRITPMFWVLLLVMGLGITALFQDGVSLMVQWWEKDEYSHGYLIAPIVAFLIWQKKDQLERIQFTGSWAGLVVLIFGLLLFFAGELNAPYIVIQYGFLITLAGLVLAFMGWKAFKLIWIPLLILAFMVPLPNIIYRNLSAALQLVSSEIGVAFIRLFDISVYLEGNVIDLGSYKLQVVEACSGLRYLFPLMTLGFIAAYFFNGAFWKRAIIFLSSIPITILMNSFRIGVIGVTVEYGGQAMAEGFLHDFEGWFVFMACTGILIIEMWVLARIGKDRKPLREAFGLDFPEPSPNDASTKARNIPVQFFAAFAALILAFLMSTQTESRTEIIPERMAFSRFPDQIGAWKGERIRMEQIYVDELKFDDYILTNYSDGNGVPINFYVAYYGSQATGESSHSPRNCLPGGGWQIKDSSTKEIPEVMIGGAPLLVNRFEIRQGDAAQLVYYWFQGRNRVTTNEYMVKWYLLWDAITKKRTDGALVRLTIYVSKGDDMAEADRRLVSFAKEIVGGLDDFIPN
jgi:exosortase D (VPLPA-CTERM-specific)